MKKTFENIQTKKVYKIITVYDTEDDIFVVKNDIENQYITGLKDLVVMYYPYSVIDKMELMQGEDIIYILQHEKIITQNV